MLATAQTARSVMNSIIAKGLFGHSNFRESEEYQEFQYKFLISLMVSGALFTGIFLVADAVQINPLGGPHMRSMTVFTVSALVLSAVLRGRKHLFKPVAWTYLGVCMIEYTSALVFVSIDELRVLWFFVNVPGVFILMGKRAGWVVTLGTCAGLAIGNQYLPHPYSLPAMVTAVLAMGYLGVFFHAYTDRSISYFKRMREYTLKLQELATHDALTGLLNARAYYAQCDQHILAASRTGEGFSVLFIDLDHFKSVNDTYGHDAGDAVLKAVAKTLQANIRRSDFLGRVGGEEFSAFLPNASTPSAVQVAESVRQAVEKTMPDIGTKTLKITASIGVASSSGSVQSMQLIQREADQAMYVAKANGRNRVSLLARA